MHAVKCWNRLPAFLVKSPSVFDFDRQLDCACFRAGGLDEGSWLHAVIVWLNILLIGRWAECTVNVNVTLYVNLISSVRIVLIDCFFTITVKYTNEHRSPSENLIKSNGEY